MLNQLVRYSAVLPLITELGGGRLLDVGSGSASIAPRLGRGWQVTALDRSFDDYGTADGPVDNDAERVIGDATALPFPDASFDVVVALDVMEHVPPASRATVMTEIARVAARRAIVACPAGSRAHAADRRLSEHYAGAGLTEPGWLSEHVAHPFPEPQGLASLHEPYGRVRVLGNENLRFHGLLMRIESRRYGGILASHLSDALRAAGEETGRGQKAARALVKALRGFDRPPTYRTIIVLDIP